MNDALQLTVVVVAVAAAGIYLIRCAVRYASILRAGSRHASVSCGGCACRRAPAAQRRDDDG